MITRRHFLHSLAVISAAPALRGAAPDDIADTMHSFVTQRMMDADGLCRSCLSADTLAAWTNEALAKVDQRRLIDMFQNTPDKAGCLTYENALMATGEFALSQIIRHRVTKGDSALKLAHRAVRAILDVAKEGRNSMPGWLPKPLRGMAHVRDSQEISVDQYTKALIVLQAWQPFADKDEQAEINRLFIDVADFFIARKWRHAYRHRTIVTAPTHPHALGLFVLAPQLAAKASGDKRYLAELTNFNAPIDSILARDTFESGFNGISLVTEGYHAAIQAGATDPRLAKTIVHLWRAGSRCIDSTGHGFIPRDQPEPDSQGPRLAAIATIVDAIAPEIRAVEQAERILAAHRDPAQLRHVGDLKHSIAEVSITSWLVAYWRLREG